MPPALVIDADGTSQREGYRRFSELTLQPLAARIADELEAKLEAPFSFDFSGLFAFDMVGRAGSFARLRTGGVALADALAIAGLPEAEAAPPA